MVKVVWIVLTVLAASLCCRLERKTLQSKSRAVLKPSVSRKRLLLSEWRLGVFFMSTGLSSLLVLKFPTALFLALLQELLCEHA